MTLFWCLYCYISTNYTHYSGVSFVDFERVNADLEIIDHPQSTEESQILQLNFHSQTKDQTQKTVKFKDPNCQYNSIY